MTPLSKKPDLSDFYYSIFGNRISALLDRLRAAAVITAASLRGKEPVVTGGCRNCGTCCSRLSLRHGNTWIRSEKTFRRLQAENHEYSHFEITGRESTGELTFRCARLDENNLCSIHDERPKFCRDYPAPDLLLIGGQLPAQCGYGIQMAAPFKRALDEASATVDKKQPPALEQDDGK